MADVHIGESSSGQVTYDLVHIDKNPPITLPMEGNRLNMRIDLRPLLCPIGPDRFMTVDKTAFEGFRPRHVRSHRRQGAVNVPRVECRIGRFQYVGFSCSAI
jgi:hypothetical protein